jgi:tyrosine-protein phosphatase SIW14
MHWRVLLPLFPWLLGLLVIAILVGLPIGHYRTNFNQYRRLRVVTDGRVYRSGQMRGDGFVRAIQKYQIRTVLNLQSSDDDGNLVQDWADPVISASALGGPKRKESEIVTEAGAKYIQIDCNTIDQTGPNGYATILDDVYAVFDQEASYPILVHCKAGLHRTGFVVAAYRMEYEQWSRIEALEELRANRFGEFKATDANTYVMAGITRFERRKTWPDGRPRNPKPMVETNR